MYLQQIWMLQALCYCSTCIYNRSVYQRLCFINAVYLPHVSAVHILCYYYTCTYNRSGCCRLCVNIVHVLTTGLGRIYFVLLLSMYLRQDWVLQGRLALSLLSLLVSPTQLSPPLAGAGLLQSRVRVCVPPPHVTLQVLQVFQLPQFPFTGTTVKAGTDVLKA